MESDRAPSLEAPNARPLSHQWTRMGIYDMPRFGLAVFTFFCAVTVIKIVMYCYLEYTV